MATASIQVRAVIEHNQHPLLMKSGNQAGERLLWVDIDADGGGDRATCKGRIVELRQVYKPNAVLVGADQLPGHSDRDGSLADPTRSDNSEKALLWQVVHEFRDKIGTPDQVRHLATQIVPSLQYGRL